MRKEQAGGDETVSDANDRALRDTVLALTARTRAMLGELEAYRREIERSSSGRKTALLMAALGGVLGGAGRAGGLRRLESAARTLLATLPDAVELDDGGVGPAGRGDEASRG
jgi:hypothetical protein